MESNKPKIQYEILRDDITVKKTKLPPLKDDVAKDINKLFKKKNRRRREEEKHTVVENNNLLNIREKDNNSSSSSFPSTFSMTLAEFHSFSGRNFSNVNSHFKDEFNLDLQEPSLLLLLNKKTLPQFTTTVSLNVPIDHPFVNILRTDFYHNDYSTNRCLFDYNGVLYCYIYNNKDLLTSFKYKLEVFQCFNLQKFQSVETSSKFLLFVLGKNGAIYFCVLQLEGKQFIIIKSQQDSMQNKKVITINGLCNFIFLYNSKGEPCCIADISNNELDIVMY
jgi:hypothetical protein